MPRDSLGQMCSFASELDPDEQYANFVTVRARRNDTIKAIAGRRGHPELAKTIAKLNGIRSITMKLKAGRLLRIPGTLEAKLSFDCHFQDGLRPKITDGYAIFDQVTRYGEKSLTHFTGYNALEMPVPILFEGWSGRHGGSGEAIEAKIRTLERMAGRGPGFPGAASGPPAIVRVSATDNYGNVCPIIPLSFQWNPGSKGAGILWRVTGIDWDDGALSDDDGNRVRQTAMVHLREHTPVQLATTVVQRAKKQARAA